MLGDTLIGIIKVRTWWKLFYFLQLAIFIVSIISMTIKPWVYSSLSGMNFQGSLNKSESHDDMSYYSMSLRYCSLYTETKKNSDKSLCLLFTTLLNGSWCFIIFEALSLVSLIIWLCFMIKIITGANTFCASYAFCGISFASHILACVLWYFITEASFIKKCADIPNDGELPILCASYGPILALCNVGQFIVLVVIYLIIVRIFSKKIKTFQFQVNPQVEMPTIPTEPQDINLNKIKIAISDATPETTAGSPANQAIKKLKPKKKITGKLANVFTIN